jgi:hypothetical protein
LKMAESAEESPPGRADGSRQTVRRWTTTAVACATSVNDDDDDDGSNTNHDSTDSKDSTPTSSYSKDFLAGKAAVVVREKMGQVSLALADWVNDNLILARTGVLVSVTVLGAYGVSQTPLFFRYPTVAALPPATFQGRVRLWGRLMCVDVDSARAAAGVASSSSSSNSRSRDPPAQPVRCYVRHVSPVEAFLPTSTWRWLLHICHPSSVALGIRRPQENPRNMLHVEVAGLQQSVDAYSPSTDSSRSNNINNSRRSPQEENAAGACLARLARENTAVTIQLLARRRVVTEGGGSEDDAPQGGQAASRPAEKKKRPIPGLEQTVSSFVAEEDSSSCLGEQIAIGHLSYRPKTWQWRATDVAYSMVRYGRASLLAEGDLWASSSSSSSSSSSCQQPPPKEERIVDASENLVDLRADAQYLQDLAAAEYEAAAERRGLWADPTFRQERSDVVAEVEFQATASFWQKLWRRFRG